MRQSSPEQEQKQQCQQPTTVLGILKYQNEWL